MMTRFLAVAILFIALPVHAADAPAPGIPVVGVGVTSADQKTVFLPGKDGIEAVDLASGRSLWTNKAANRLAGVSDKLVLAWLGDDKKPNAFRVVVLNAETGEPVCKSDPIEMPDWARTAKVGGRSFRTAATADGGRVVVVWEARAFYYGGARPTPQIEAAARKHDSGQVKIDLKSGKVTVEEQKPKEDSFKLGPSGGFNNKLGDYEFQTREEIPKFKPGMANVTKVTFTVVKEGKTVWTRELIGNPWSPPPP